jgi:drug/metabolite transporter (DMT)-like permease
MTPPAQAAATTAKMRHPGWALASIAVLSLIWGYTWVLAKQGLAYAPPFAFAAERSLGGAAATFLALMLLGRSMRLEAPWQTLLIGVVQTGGFIGLQTWALVEGGAGKTAVLIFTMPIWTLLMAWPFLGERIRGAQWLVAAAMLVGLALIIEPWNMDTSPLSKALGVAAAVSWAIGTILIKRLLARRKVDLLSLTAWQMLFGALALVLVAGVLAEPQTHWTPAFIAILAFIAIISTALCWGLWAWILDRVPAWEASLSVLGTPVVAIASSRLVLDEGFSIAEVSGMVLIGTGLASLSLLGWIASRRASR